MFTYPTGTYVYTPYGDLTEVQYVVDRSQPEASYLVETDSGNQFTFSHGRLDPSPFVRRIGKSLLRNEKNAMFEQGDVVTLINGDLTYTIQFPFVIKRYGEFLVAYALTYCVDGSETFGWEFHQNLAFVERFSVLKGVTIEGMVMTP